MSMIPPPSDDEANKLSQDAGLTGAEEPSGQNETEPAAMTLAAIGKGGDGGPLGIEGFGNDDDSSGADFSRFTQHSAFVIGLVAVIAVVVLGLMRITSGSMETRTDADTERRVEETLAKLQYRDNMAPGDPHGTIGTDQIVNAAHIIKTLTRNNAPQVPIEYVQKNPFELALQEPVQQAALVKPKVDNTKKDKARMRQALSKLSIDMIMDGTDEKAVVINGEIYKVDDTIDIFRVEKIESGQIFLRHGKYRIPLKVAG